MSWEKMNQSECPCPCGDGRVFYNNYADDWNRFKSDEPTIDCSECIKKYHIETFGHNTYKGECRSTHYCVSNDYPSYTGTEFQGKFTDGYNIEDLDCTQYFVENYSFDTLTDVLSVLSNCGTYSKIEDKGIGIKAREIVRRYKGFYKTQRITLIIESVKQAINDYFKYECRFDTLEKGLFENKKYVEQKMADSILLNL